MKLNTRSTGDRHILGKPITPQPSSSNIRYTGGYTIVEILVIVGIIGIFSGIAVPAWIAFVSRQELRAGATRVYWAMQSARSEAKRQKTSFQASFREQNNRVQWAVHPPSVPPNKLSESAWESLPPGVEVDKGPQETTLLKVKPDTNQVTTSNTNYYRALFNYKGCPVYNSTDECTQVNRQAKGRLGLKHKNLDKPKRCVIISTLIGVIRIGQEHDKKESGKERYCY